MKTLTEDYILSEVRQTDKDKYYMISLCVGRAAGRMDWELGMDMYTLLILNG